MCGCGGIKGGFKRTWWVCGFVGASEEWGVLLAADIGWDLPPHFAALHTGLRSGHPSGIGFLGLLKTLGEICLKKMELFCGSGV